MPRKEYFPKQVLNNSNRVLKTSQNWFKHSIEIYYTKSCVKTNNTSMSKNQSNIYFMTL